MLANNMECKVLGISVVKVMVFDVILKTLANVKHVPELGESPISFRLILLFGLWIFSYFA